MKITSIAQLFPQIREVVLTNYLTGEEFVVSMRDLMPSELVVIDSTLKQPEPPIKTFKNGAPVFDDKDPKYRREREEADQEYVYRWILAAWQVEYPEGIETPEQKLEVLKNPKTGIPYWAFNEFARRLREATGLSMSDVALAKKNFRMMNSENQST